MKKVEIDLGKDWGCSQALLKLLIKCAREAGMTPAQFVTMILENFVTEVEAKRKRRLEYTQLSFRPCLRVFANRKLLHGSRNLGRVVSNAFPQSHMRH